MNQKTIVHELVKKLYLLMQPVVYHAFAEINFVDWQTNFSSSMFYVLWYTGNCVTINKPPSSRGGNEGTTTAIMSLHLEMEFGRELQCTCMASFR